MKLSFDWLSEYVDLSGLSPQEVADKLTMGAFEVEEVRKFGSDIQGPLVVGKILEIYPHPNADKVRLTKILVDEGAEPLEIVCGAHNISVGDLIPVALPGAKVINRKDGSELPIKAGAIRGVVSNGMLCSPPELGLSGDAEAGILILSAQDDKRLHKIGANVQEVLDLKGDWVLHVEPRSNRGDALSVIGLAREVAALVKRPLIKPQWNLAEVTAQDEAVAIGIKNSDDCPYFSARLLFDLKLQPSPRLIQKRLEAVGVRTVNNVVDITNYVMHEHGQPLHAYDLNNVRDRRLVVRRAKTGEKLVTIDAKERLLNDEVMVIADGQGVVGVAGVMGGKESEIGDATTALALEAAAFNQARVRRASRFLGLSSESSLRFERGVDVAGVARASDRAAFLMMQYCGTPRLGRFSSAGDDRVKPVAVSLRLKQLKRTMDVEFSPSAVKELLEPLGFDTKFTGSDCDHVEVTVPSYRQSDVTREIDIVEEVCRLFGYDKLPVRMPMSTIAANPAQNATEAARDTLSGFGLNEAWLSSLVGGEGDEDQHSIVRVLNPLSADHKELRQSLIPGLIKAAAYNNDRGQSDVWLFEVGRTYKRASELNGCDKDAFDSGTGVLEHQQVGALLMGASALSDWVDQSAKTTGLRHEPADFYRAKGMVENLLQRLGIDMAKVRFFRPESAPAYLHPARSCQVALDKGGQAPPQNGSKERPHAHLNIIGWLGELHPAQADNAGFKETVYLFELNLDVIQSFKRKRSFREIPATPPVVRDLTVDVAEVVDHAAVRSCILASAGADLKDLDLVSIYQPAPEQKSLSFRLTFQSADKTLTNSEVEDRLLRMRESLIKRLGASFRE